MAAKISPLHIREMHLVRLILSQEKPKEFCDNVCKSSLSSAGGAFAAYCPQWGGGFLISGPKKELDGRGGGGRQLKYHNYI